MFAGRRYYRCYKMYPKEVLLIETCVESVLLIVFSKITEFRENHRKSIVVQKYFAGIYFSSALYSERYYLIYNI